MASHDLTSVDVVVPLFDERDGVPALLAGLAEVLPRLPRARLILVDDGSRDGTGDRVAADLPSFAGPAVLLRHRRNLGLSQALVTGFAAGRGDIVCWLDADLSYEPAVLEQLVGRLVDGAGLALASPYHPRGRVEGVPPHRLLLSRGLSEAYRLLLGSGVHTWSSMVRAWRRSLLARCLPHRQGHLGVVESLLLARQCSARIVEVPACLRGRRAGRSGLRILPAIVRHLGLLQDSVLGRLGSPVGGGR